MIGDITLKNGVQDDKAEGTYFSSSRSVEDFRTRGISRSANSEIVPIQRLRSEDSASVSVRLQPRVVGLLSPDATKLPIHFFPLQNHNYLANA